MMSFFKKSKNNAKSRLFSCIETDRAGIYGKTSEKIKKEIESILSKYVELEGSISLEIAPMGRGSSYLTTAVVVKGTIQ